MTKTSERDRAIAKNAWESGWGVRRDPDATDLEAILAAVDAQHPAPALPATMSAEEEASIRAAHKVGQFYNNDTIGTLLSELDAARAQLAAVVAALRLCCDAFDDISVSRAECRARNDHARRVLADLPAAARTEAREWQAIAGNATEAANAAWGHFAEVALALGYNRAASPDFGEVDLVPLREHITKNFATTIATSLAAVSALRNLYEAITAPDAFPAMVDERAPGGVDVQLIENPRITAALLVAKDIILGRPAPTASLPDRAAFDAMKRERDEARETAEIHRVDAVRLCKERDEARAQLKDYAAAREAVVSATAERLREVFREMFGATGTTAAIPIPPAATEPTPLSTAEATAERAVIDAAVREAEARARIRDLGHELEAAGWPEGDKRWDAHADAITAEGEARREYIAAGDRLLDIRAKRDGR